MSDMKVKGKEFFQPVIENKDKLMLGVAGVAGSVYVAAGVVNGIRAGNFREFLSSAFSKDSGEAFLAFTAGSLLLGGVISKIRKPNNVKTQRTSNMLLTAGTFLAIFPTVSYFGDTHETSKTVVESSTTVAELPSTATTVVLTKGPEGQCELELPLADGDSNGVRKIQGALNEAGYDSGPTDGMQGKVTEFALAEFKSDYGFPVSENFNYSMCQYFPSLNDGNDATPTVTYTPAG